MAEGISIRLTHTGLTQSSIFIDDIREGEDRMALGRKAGPNYVPADGFIELAYSGLVAISFELGAIRSFINNGYLSAEFILSPLFIAALPGGLTPDSLYSFNQRISVPKNSVLFLKNGEVPLSAAPMAFKSDGALSGATISVDKADTDNDYALRILVNGTIKENLTLPAGSNKVVTSGFTTLVSSGDLLSAYLERTAGLTNQKSDFDQVSVSIHFKET